MIKCKKNRNRRERMKESSQRYSADGSISLPSMKHTRVDPCIPYGSCITTRSIPECKFKICNEKNRMKENGNYLMGKRIKRIFYKLKEY